MTEVADGVGRIRISDPVPTACVACWNSPTEGMRFVDFQAAFDAGAIVDGGGAVVKSLDELHLCESCVAGAAEALAYKPVQHTNILREMDRLKADNNGLRAHIKSLRAALATNPDPVPSRRR